MKIILKQFIDKTIAMATIAVAIFSIITSCSSGSDKITIDARFLNMNQANFYVYSPDGVITGVDTINVQAGRFTYEVEAVQAGTLIIIFPNYATIPVFVSPGDDIDIEANAAHLRTMEITGNDDNKLFTEWRKNCDKMSPKEITRQAELFINDHPESAAARWLVLQQFILSPTPDIKKAKGMLKKMQKASENNLQVSLLLNKIKNMQDLNIGGSLPRFTAKDINGNPVLNGKFQSGKSIICLWASWNYESQSMLRQIASKQRFGADSTKVNNVLTICLDPDIKQCRKTLKDCGAEELTTVCDTTMWDSPLISTFGFSTIPDNLLVVNGKIKGRHMPTSDMLK